MELLHKDLTAAKSIRSRKTNEITIEFLDRGRDLAV